MDVCVGECVYRFIIFVCVHNNYYMCDWERERDSA